MRAYMTAWRGAVDPNDETGIGTFTCRDKEIKLRMVNFQQYLTLCELIDAVVKKAKQRQRIEIFDYINSYKSN
jgi:hypothetical protein